ncbi:MAG: cation-translocating P-type ATPase [Clostridiales bacterium]|nr:cation-translocating P-type ATPase [Clostridiales bacterium]
MQKRLSETGRILCVLAAVCCTAVFFGGILRGNSPGDMLLLSLCLRAAVIPESLPAIVTIMLSSGICLLSKKGVIVRRLVCAESLGQIKAVFLNPNKIGDKEKAELESAGIEAADKNDKETFYKIWCQGKTFCFVGEEDTDKRYMTAADIGCCFDTNPELYGISHMVFKNLDSLPEAVKVGQVIYDNLKKSLHFLLSCNLGELLCIFISVIAGLEMPLSAVQLLMVNLITDCLPAIAMAAEPPEENIMKRPPIEEEKLFTAEFITKITFEGIIIGAVSLCAFLFGKTVSGLTTGRTMAFAVLCISQLFHSFNMREKGLFKNKFLNLSFIIGTLMVILASELPFGAEIFGLSHLGLQLWFDVFLLSFFPFII